MKKITVSELILVPVVIGLIFSMFINGITLIQGNPETIGTFMNFYNRIPVETLPSFSMPAMLFVAALQILTVLLLITALIKRQFLFHQDTRILKWGIWTAILSVVMYGFAVRMISNHQAAANLFYYTGLLYLLLWYVEKHTESIDTLFEKLKVLPLFFTMIYTMGQPGFQKIFAPQEVIPKYVEMFKDSFLAQLPGGIPPFIYLLGVFEITVAILLIISVVKREFLPAKNKLFFSIAMITGTLTFIMLAFGLSVLLMYPGATNLVFYAIFCLFFYYYTTHPAD